MDTATIKDRHQGALDLLNQTGWPIEKRYDYFEMYLEDYSDHSEDYALDALAVMIRDDEG